MYGKGGTAAPMEETDPGSDKPPLRTASRPPQKAQRDEQWVPSIQRGVPISIQLAAALGGREAQRPHAAKATKSSVMGVARTTTHEPKSRCLRRRKSQREGENGKGQRKTR